MKLLTRAAALLAVAGILAFVSQWVRAAGVEGNSYSYETIPTPDVPDVHTGCGEFEPAGRFLVTIDSPTPVYDGTWRQRRFRRMTFFKSKFDVDYGGFIYDFNVTGVMPRDGFMVGSATYYDPDGDRNLVRWRAEQDAACDLTL